MRSAMFTILAFALWLAGNASVPADDKDDSAKEQKRFQGTWTFISAESDGKSQDRFKDAKAVVEGDRVTVTFAKFGKFTRTFKLYTDTNPRCVDFLNENGKGDTSD